MGKRNSIKCRVLVKNPDVYFVGCPWHIMQDVKERIAFLELLDSYVGNIPALEKILLSGSEKQPRFKRLTVTKQFCRNTMLSTASGVLRLPDPLLSL
jgi:hypothetical protein